VRAHGVPGLPRGRRSSDAPPRRHVWVLSGGGARGAAQAGAIAALLDAGIRPVALVGCSVGALNAAFIACGPDPLRAAALEQRWLTIDRADVFGSSRLATVRNVVARRAALFPQEPLSRLIETWLPAVAFEELAVRLRVVTTVLSTGQPAYHDSGPLSRILLASAALPGLFAPVPLPLPGGPGSLVPRPDVMSRIPRQRRRTLGPPPGTQLHVDGGISQIVPLHAAEAANPTDVWVLDVAAAPGTGYWRARGALSVLGASVTASMRARPAPPWDAVTVHHLALRSDLGGRTSVMDFSHAAELIALGRAVAGQAIERAGLSPHALRSAPAMR
jgi:NTE family protein